MTNATANLYDAVPYQSGSFPHTHPQHVAMLGTLFGMSPAPVENCRVLELGCAEGGNLIPMAVDLPGSRFLGVDFSRRQIEDGLATIRDLNLTNIELRHGDILEFDGQAGQFDFIIAHGVYSWVPEAVRFKLLEICRDHLSEQGIAFISFNANPGGHIRRMVREMMMFHLKRFSDPVERVSEARQLLDFLIESALEKDEGYRAALEWERRHVQLCLDHQLLHDLLEEVNEPFFVSEVVDHAQRHQLQYLGDANFPSMLPRNFEPEVFEKLKTYARSLVEMEQYMDFVRNRAFRQMLLCRQELRLNHQLEPAAVMPFYVSAGLKPLEPQPDVRSRANVSFADGKGAEISTNVPITKAAFAVLREIWPGNLHFAELLDQARVRVNDPFATREADAAALATSLLTCSASGIAQFSMRRYPCGAAAGEFPAASPLSRYQAASGDVVTNLRHETVRIEPWQRPLLAELDGGQSREDLATRLSAPSYKDRFLIGHEAHGPNEPHFLRQAVKQRVDDGLTKLARYGLVMQ